ncbi:hypothetical protein MNBD_GAMMA01-2198, partial [hydrothermal vent metagenome]
STCYEPYEIIVIGYPWDDNWWDDDFWDDDNDDEYDSAEDDQDGGDDGDEPAQCSYGNSNGNGENNDEDCPDIQCFGSTITIGPLTAMEAEIAQQYQDFFNSLFSGGAGLAAGALAYGLGLPPLAYGAAGVVVESVMEALLNMQQNSILCGKITTIETQMCVGPDIGQMGTPTLSDFWGDHILTVETSYSTGVCVDDTIPPY